MDQDTVATVPTRQMVVFRIAEEIFTADIGVVREVIKLENVTPVPGSPDTVAGIVNIRGRIVPLLELGELLRIGKHTAKEAFVLLVDTPDNGVVGMVVDEVVEIRHFEVEEIKPAPKVLTTKVSPDFIAGVILPKNAKGDEDVMLLIDLYATVNKSIAEMLEQIRTTQPAVAKEG